MCSFVGFSNFNKNLSTPEDINNIKILTKSLFDNGQNKENIFLSKYVNLGHKINILTSEDKKFMSLKYNNNIYTIVYNGELYNSNDIRTKLINYGYEFNRLF